MAMLLRIVPLDGGKLQPDIRRETGSQFSSQHNNTASKLSYGVRYIFLR